MARPPGPARCRHSGAGGGRPTDGPAGVSVAINLRTATLRRLGHGKAGSRTGRLASASKTKRRAQAAVQPRQPGWAYRMFRPGHSPGGAAMFRVSHQGGGIDDESMRRNFTTSGFLLLAKRPSPQHYAGYHP